MTLFWFGIAWLAGIAVSTSTNLGAWQWLMLSAGSFSGAILFRRQIPFSKLFQLLFILCLGAARFQLTQKELNQNHIAWHNDSGTYATIRGTVVKPPDIRDTYIGLQVDVEKIRFGDETISSPIEGRILARTGASPAPGIPALSPLGME